MTNGEAIKLLDDFPHCETCGATPDCSKCREALDMATEALKQPGIAMEWIDPEKQPPTPNDSPFGRWCIVCDKNGHVYPLRYARREIRGKTVERWQYDDGRIYYGEVVAYMYMPNPPEGGVER